MTSSALWGPGGGQTTQSFQTDKGENTQEHKRRERPGQHAQQTETKSDRGAFNIGWKLFQVGIDNQ